MKPKAVKRVLVVGAGTMGNGIAQVFARACDPRIRFSRTVLRKSSHIDLALQTLSFSGSGMPNPRGDGTQCALAEDSPFGLRQRTYSPAS